MGIAIQKAKLVEQAAKKSRELETLVRINRDLASQLTDEMLLPRIVQDTFQSFQPVKTFKPLKMSGIDLNDLNRLGGYALDRHESVFFARPFFFLVAQDF